MQMDDEIKPKPTVYNSRFTPGTRLVSQWDRRRDVFWRGKKRHHHLQIGTRDDGYDGNAGGETGEKWQD